MKSSTNKHRKYPLDVFEAALESKGWIINVARINETHYDVEVVRGQGEIVKVSNTTNIDYAIKDIWEIIVERFDKVPLKCGTSIRNSLTKRQMKSTLVYTASCHYCACKLTTTNFSWDHVIPKSKGGSNDLKNLVACCKECNHQKGDLPLEEFLRRKLRGLKPTE